jgi:hypothetical protein
MTLPETVPTETFMPAGTRMCRLFERDLNSTACWSSEMRFAAGLDLAVGAVLAGDGDVPGYSEHPEAGAFRDQEPYTQMQV